jgi:hypothetical protein
MEAWSQTDYAAVAGITAIAATRAISRPLITMEKMTIPKIRQARRRDRNELAKMQGLLWVGERAARETSERAR